MSKVDILEKISYGLLWGYALVSCWGMDRLPAGFVSVSGLIYLARFAIAPYRIVGVPVLQRAFFVSSNRCKHPFYTTENHHD